MIVVGGENLIDFIQVEGANQTPVYQANPGGAPYNCAKAVGRQNTPVGYLTPISTDSLGEVLAREITASNVTLLSPRREEPTSLAVVSLADGIPSYQFYREGTAERQVSLDALTNATPGNTQAIYVGSLALTSGADSDVWAQYYVDMHAKGIFTALDPNIRTSFINDRDGYLLRLNKVLAATDLLKLSDEDLAWLFPEEPQAKAANMLIEQTSAKLLVVTLGEDGAFALSNGRKITVPSAKVHQLRDTVGAGDTFMATLLSRLEKLGRLHADALADMNATDIEDLLSWAACAAALNCEKDGCNPPDLSTLQKRMDV